jgi:serine/threonine protein kinase
MDSFATLFIIILWVFLGIFALAAAVFLIGKIFGITFMILGNIFRFIGAEVTDLLRFVSSVLASVLFAPLVVLSIVIGRWSASKHYAGSLMSELRGATRCVYRFFIGNPARLFGLGGALEGVERRVPEAMAAAPTRDKPSKKRVGMFDGYKIVGSLKGGGSGGKLYIAEPDDVKQAVFAKRKLGEIDQVVIKVFSLNDGSSLPQIVRESRALDAARQLGLVLEHEMSPERFYYVMRYVPGESLSVVTQRMHTMSPSDGLGDEEMGKAMGYMRDLLVALDTYHNAELWHKDVKPDNIIVDGRDDHAHAHLVDFGLVTPMRSAMTLTTHGTEYFRDPELVRQALRGVKVHQIDGSKFDVYAAGAVLYSIIENSFPAHGGLSQITKRCPEAIRWIVRRAMAEYDRRYPSAAVMLADLRVVMEAQDPFALKPIDLPSVAEGDAAAEDMVESAPTPEWDDSVQPDFARRAGTPVPPRVDPSPRKGGRVGRPNTATDFWSGRYRVAGNPVVTPQRKKRVGRPKKGVVIAAGVGKDGPFVHVNDEPVRRRPLRDPGDRRPAREQVKTARARAEQRRANAAKRIQSARARRAGRKADYNNTPGAAVVFGGLLGIAVLFAIGTIGYSVVKLEREDSRGGMPGQYAAHVEGHANAELKSDSSSISVDHKHYDASYGAPETRDAQAWAESAEMHQVDAELLLIANLPQLIDPEFNSGVLSSTQLMEQSGVSFIGSVVASEDDEYAIELNASLKNKVGSTPFDSEEYPTLVQEWLLSKPFDGVLVLYNQAIDSDRTVEKAYLITDKFYSDHKLDDSVVHTLLKQLAQSGYEKD